MLRIVVVAVTLFSTAARADEWATPTERTLVSPNQKFQAVVTPAADGKSAASAALRRKGRRAKTFLLSTPWMPVDTVLLDSGRLLALDNWHELGYGRVATLYERDGTVRWTKTLVDLIGQQLMDSAPHSVSSIWWRKRPLELSLTKDGRSALITLFDENQMKLRLRDGMARVVKVDKLPDDPQRLLNRALSLEHQPGQQAAVLALLERAIAKAPDLFGALLLYVKILQRSKDHARAVAVLNREAPRWKTKKGYDLANIYVLWAKSLTALSRITDAERVLRRGVAAAPTYTNPAVELAGLLLDHARRRDGVAVLDDFVDRLFKAPSLDTYSLAAVADFFKQRKDLARALALYLRGYKKNRVTNQFLYASMATLYEEMGNDAEAIRINQQLLTYFQKMGSAFDNYAKRTSNELARLRAKRVP